MDNLNTPEEIVEHLTWVMQNPQEFDDTMDVDRYVENLAYKLIHVCQTNVRKALYNV